MYRYLISTDSSGAAIARANCQRPYVRDEVEEEASWLLLWNHVCGIFEPYKLLLRCLHPPEPTLQPEYATLRNHACPRRGRSDT